MAWMPHWPRGAVAFLVLFVLLLLPASCRRRTAPQAMQGPVVRVRLLQSQSQVFLAATSPPMLRAASESSPRTVQFPDDAPAQVLLSDAGWRVGGNELGTGELVRQPSGDGT